MPAAGNDCSYRSNMIMTASPHLIMLFILAFHGITQEQSSPLPSSNSTIIFQRWNVSDETEEDDDNNDYQIKGYSYTYSSPYAPQDVAVTVQDVYSGSKEKTVVKLVAENSVEKFMWADRMDAAMGFMKGTEDVMADKNPYDIAEHKINWRERTPSKCDLSRPLFLL